MKSFENKKRGRGQFKQLRFVIPAWSAGIQVYMDVSGSVRANLDAGYPCPHDGLLRALPKFESFGVYKRKGELYDAQ
jgi:hypothetical protein